MYVCTNVAPSTGPVDIAVSNITSTSFSVTWLPPAYPDQNGVIRTYSLTLTDMTTGNSTVFSVESNVTSFHFDDLHPAYLYSLEIAAATVSQGPNSEPVQVEMDEDSKSVKFSYATKKKASGLLISFNPLPVTKWVPIHQWMWIESICIESRLVGVYTRGELGLKQIETD